jgi:hypothetical protein
MKSLIAKLAKTYPAISFAASDKFYWSPKEQTVYYDTAARGEQAQWALIHELSHGLLGHKNYKTDFELLRLEVAAWHMAESVAKDLAITIDQDHVQDCLDTYRDWLHARSKCPECGEHGIQNKSGDYTCINCRAVWHVSQERFCRAYRRKKQ